ncbi:streptomycin biosynthesis protein StrG [Lentzea sp. PSKA42]|uniref:Streptomycin biosynthesis protein StrG n=1 Tax=Lentzea indica TaxID=2604800 RepID=A0ABX1FT46_9PSEU|nr:streptomycin biosynthesis protein StrG [Lentzea indica]NKE61636.1 streptomycin biosynthesis protein StrG [Lentzea indica]
MRPSVHNYDRTRFDFGSALRRIYDVEDLSTLAPDTPVERFTWQTDQATEFHAAFYRAFEPEVNDLYREFVAAFVPEVLGTKEFCFQRVPTFRIHFPGNVAVGEFHTDGDYNHAAGEVNFWVPFTRCWGTNSVWIETELGNGDHRPWELEPGQLLKFDAVHWNHGNKVNDTGSTRVSFDFRCIPMADYAPSEKRSMDAKRGMWIGEYFDVL